MVRAFDLLAGLPDDLSSREERTICRRNARDWDGASLFVGYQHLHLHPAETTGRSVTAISQAPPGGSCAFCHHVWGIALSGCQERATDGNDLWIAAHALAAGLTAVTNNEKEFRRVSRLKVENWAA